MRLLKNILALCVLSVLLPSTSGAITLGEILDPLDKTFADCSRGDSSLQVICTRLQNEINLRLQQAGLSLDGGNLVYSATSGVGSVLYDTCSRKTTWNSWSANATLDRSASIRLAGNAISKPAVFGITLPVHAYFRGDFRDDFGVDVPYLGGFPPRLKHKCVGVGSDSYYGDSTASATAKLVVLLSLEPRYVISSSGHFVVMLKPFVDVSASIDNVNTNLDFHGVSVLSNLFQIVNAPIAGVNGQLAALADGGNIKTILANSTYAQLNQLINVSQGTLLNDFALGGVLDQFANDYLQNYAKKQANAGANSFQSAVLNSLRSKIAAALNLDAQGQVIYALDGNFNLVTPTPADISEVSPPQTQKIVTTEYGISTPYGGMLYVAPNVLLSDGKTLFNWGDSTVWVVNSYISSGFIRVLSKTDPGQSWLVSATIHGKTMTGDSAVYRYDASAGSATWSWPTLFGFVGSGVTTGYIKYR